MNEECKIKTDDEILEEETNRYNFRRFTPQEITAKNSPFERFKKKEYPFLFQKKKVVTETNQILLENIIQQVNDLSIGFKPIDSPRSPPYPRITPPPPLEIPMYTPQYLTIDTIPTLVLDEQNTLFDLSANEILMLDGSK